RSTDSLDDRAGTDGQILTGNDVRIVDENEADVPTGRDGDILTRGPGLFRGYTDPGLDETVMTRDGWFRTGDIGRVDEHGHLTIVDRKKDLIIRGGENLSPKEIEDVLSTHPDLDAVAVVGYPDERYGEVAC